ncbi:hypothetical protein [Vibrio coralliilyticus]|uniref:hypothetical protein n=1 Tax=Vibrio coralliilyticus TaxID=190893 RepID=UPI001E4BA821|nr:hypothetical protein [Vibrio coralliilyticus]MCC2525049.1 hypothetical protein [Vibrio coralliilyticus]
MESKIKGDCLVRLISSTLGTGYILAGVLVNSTSNLQLLDSKEQHKLFSTLEHSEVTYLKAEIDDVKNAELSTGNAVFGHITIDTNSNIPIILDSKGASSVTDAGTHTLAVNFIHQQGKYIYSVLTSEPLKIVSAIESSTSLKLTFDKPYSGDIQILFMENTLGLT